MDEIKVKVAIATDDGKTLTTEHFGSAKYYLIYSVDLGSGDIEDMGKIANTTKEEETHGDPEKAKEVSALFVDTPILVGFAMGPNIARIRKKFVPVISRERSIALVLPLLKGALPAIQKSLQKGGDKDVVYLQNSAKNKLSHVMHPEIRLSLVELGIIGSITEESGQTIVELKLPFPEVPIKELLESLILDAIGENTKVITSIMTEAERERFMELSRANWAL